MKVSDFRKARQENRIMENYWIKVALQERCGDCPDIYALTTRTSQVRCMVRGRRETRNDNPHSKSKPNNKPSLRTNPAKDGT